MRRFLAVTMGDPAGIGPEITVRALSSITYDPEIIPVVIGDLTVLREARKRFRINARIIPVNEEDIDKLNPRKGEVYVLDTGFINGFKDIAPGKIAKRSGYLSYKYIEVSVKLAVNGIVIGMVTSPINKEAIKLAGIKEDGHTEILSKLTGAKNTVTMFMVDKLKIFFHSRHIPFRRIIETLTEESLLRSIKIADMSLKSIGYSNPTLALAALNPHASDGGLFGNEENEILQPVVRVASEIGYNIRGPIPADSVFYQCLRGDYDAVISLYHDQGHIASKTYDFYRTISVTFGLPFIRTSVDHGTAFDIAWKGVANPISMIEAVKVGCKLARLYNSNILQWD